MFDYVIHIFNTIITIPNYCVSFFFLFFIFVLYFLFYFIFQHGVIYPTATAMEKTKKKINSNTNKQEWMFQQLIMLQYYELLTLTQRGRKRDGRMCISISVICKRAIYSIQKEICLTWFIKTLTYLPLHVIATTMFCFFFLSSKDVHHINFCSPEKKNKNNKIN